MYTGWFVSVLTERNWENMRLRGTEESRRLILELASRGITRELGVLLLHQLSSEFPKRRHPHGYRIHLRRANSRETSAPKGIGFDPLL